MPNEIEIKVKATGAGTLVSDIKAATTAATAAAGDVPIKLTVSASEAEKLGKDAGSNFLTGFGSKTADLNPGSGSFAVPLPLLAGAIPIVGGLVSSIESLAGIAPVAAAGMVGAGLAAVTMKLGMSGVTEAIQAFATASEATNGKTAQLAAQQLSTANSIISANQAVASARQAAGDVQRSVDNTAISDSQSVANAQQAASQAIVTADRNNEAAADSYEKSIVSLQNAEESEAAATRALTQAKQDAARAIEDANNKVKDSELAHKQAVLDLQHAQDALTAYSLTSQGALAQLAQAQADVLNPTKDHAQALIDLTTAQDVYNKAKSNTTGPPTQDIQQLSLAVQQASQRVDETAQSFDRAGQDATTASKRGVDGATSVISAQQQLVNAHHSVADAVQAVADAEDNKRQVAVNSDNAIQQSSQALDNALRKQRDDVITGDEQIQKSKQAVNDAIRSQVQTVAAAAATAESAAGSMSLFNAQLAELSPNARGAVLAVTGLYEEWKALTRSVQDKLFAGMGDEIRKVAAADLPVFRTGLGNIAGGIDDIILRMGDWLASKDATELFRQLLSNVADAAHKIAPAIGPALDILMRLITAGSEFLPGLAGSFADAAQRADDFIKNAQKTGQLREWIQSGIDVIRDLWSITKDVVGIFNDLTGKRGFSSSFMDDMATLVHDARVLADYLGTAVGWVNSVSTALQHIPGYGILGGFFSGHASGGPGGGLSLVGEQGPELVNLPHGSQVMPAGNTAGMLNSGSGQDVHVHMYWDTTGASSVEQAIFDIVKHGIRIKGGIGALTR